MAYYWSLLQQDEEANRINYGAARLRKVVKDFGKLAMNWVPLRRCIGDGRGS